MLAAVLGFGHPAADRLEDLGPAQFWDQQTESVAARGRIGTYVAS